MLGERSFAVGGPSLWNQLSDTVREAENVESFKTRLKTHLFGLSFNSPISSSLLLGALDCDHDHAYVTLNIVQLIIIIIK